MICHHATIFVKCALLIVVSFPRDSHWTNGGGIVKLQSYKESLLWSWCLCLVGSRRGGNVLQIFPSHPLGEFTFFCSSWRSGWSSLLLHSSSKLVILFLLPPWYLVPGFHGFSSQWTLSSSIPGCPPIPCVLLYHCVPLISPYCSVLFLSHGTVRSLKKEQVH